MDQLPRLKGILFDFDETLVTLAVDWPRLRKRLHELFAPDGFDSPFSPLTESLRAAREFSYGNGRAELYNAALGIAREEETLGLDGAIAMPGSKELLDAVAARGIPFAIVSNNDSLVIRAALAQFEFPSPNIIVGRDAVEHLKPEPEGARLALRELGVQPEECWLVGNSKYDAALGYALGVARTLLVGGNFQSPLGCESIPSLMEVAKSLDENQNRSAELLRNEGAAA